MTAIVTPYPLHWPLGWERTADSRRKPYSLFKNVTFTSARAALRAELDRLSAHSVVISTNLPIKADGMPYAETRLISDPGVAVYFRRNDQAQMVMARDVYRSVANNLRSLALAIDHLRGLERHGGGAMVERAFSGFAALPAPDRVAGWREVLGFEPGQEATEASIEIQFRARLRTVHPDRGGTDEQMAELNRARDEAHRAIGGG